MNNDAASWVFGLFRATASRLTFWGPVREVSIYLVIGQHHPALNTNEHRHTFAAVYMLGSFLTTFIHLTLTLNVNCHHCMPKFNSVLPTHRCLLQNTCFCCFATCFFSEIAACCCVQWTVLSLNGLWQQRPGAKFPICDLQFAHKIIFPTSVHFFSWLLPIKCVFF